MDITREQQVERLQELYRVAQLHAVVDGAEPVQLNGDRRQLDMHNWACETSACLFGSYCLTDQGKQYFWLGEILLDTLVPIPVGCSIGERPQGEEIFNVAAQHFGISFGKARYLFDPDRYLREDRDLTDIDPEDNDEVKSAPIKADVVLKRTAEILTAYDVSKD